MDPKTSSQLHGLLYKNWTPMFCLFQSQDHLTVKTEPLIKLNAINKEN